MKYTFYCALFALIISGILSSSVARAQVSDTDTSNSPTCAVLQNNLRYGARDQGQNSDVSILQDFLNTKGYLSSQPTGFFGRMTLLAVQAFQSANGISPTGYVGQFTRAKIQQIDCSTASSTVPVTIPQPVTQSSVLSQPVVRPMNNYQMSSNQASSVTNQVISPSYGASYMVGTDVPIQWSLNGATSVAINLVDLSGNIVSQISAGTPNSGSFHWIAPSLFNGNFGTYRLTITATQSTNSSATTIQSDVFSIVAVNPPLPLIPQSINYNNFGNTTPDTYLNPRVNFGGQDVITFNDDTTATQWCKMVPGKSYVRGTSSTNWANPQDGIHNRYDGTKWIQVGAADYPRYYTCYTN